MNGFSYKNVYNNEKHKKFMDSQRYVIDDKFLSETENYELSDGFSLEINTYEEEEQRKGRTVTLTIAQKVTLKNADKTVYEYYCFYDHIKPITEIIHHKNGYRYYPFHIDLYGISFLDVDTLEVYNYIPEGYEHDKEYICGESFIITDVHYDKESNLIAYGGCYWAAPYEVMVGDFSDPLDFNPHLISLYDILDPEYNYDDIDFKEWKNNRLYVLCDKEEKSLSVEELKKLINELTVKGK
ncbi:MAG: hypothetical protein K2O29_08360 [Ruminococcus sp.]|nr:hypothetical protein [Ruminococcus sp.]MDE6849491.1 hypothetical protein [Ruminococcus sp.]MDE7138452.1 hypothetical protein [Ruminococcus sp.]